MKKLGVLLTTTIMAAGALVSCSGNGGKVKIGVIREDATSGESLAWESYLKELGNQMNITFDFTTTSTSTEEVQAINTYASKGFKGVFLLSAQDMVASISAANKKKMYVVSPTGHPTSEQLSQIEDLPYYLGSVAPTSDTEFEAGYNLAKYFVENLERTNFTIFGGATIFASDMHVSRLTGMMKYLCEDETTTYDGSTDRYDIYGKVIGAGVDTTKFSSTKYQISGYMHGFDFNETFSVALANSLYAGGTAVLSVGATDAVTGIAYGIAASSNGAITDLKTGGIDAITPEYASFFDMGYTYDCGKYASAMAPALCLMKSALDGNKVTENGKAVKIGLQYWAATSKDALLSMTTKESAEYGYLYNADVVNGIVGADDVLTEVKNLAGADYAGAEAIHDRYNSANN